MSVVVLRLQGLATEAGSEDIRRFFHGLLIPEGGVHITGGEKGEAFIIFPSERQAQLAMRNSGKRLRGSSVSLHISSVDELKQKMESRLRKANTPAVENKTVPSVSFSPEVNGKLLLSLMAAIQGQLSNNKVNESQAPNQMPENFKRTVQQHSPADQTNAEFTPSGRVAHGFASTELESSGQNINSSKPGYLRLYGLPDFVAEHDVRHFLQGLSVLGIITNVRLPLGFCCLVKLASLAEAQKGLKYNNTKFKEFDVEVRPAHEKMWTDAMEQSGKCMQDMQTQSCSVPKKINLDRNAHGDLSRKRSGEEQTSLGSPKRHCQNSPPHTELYVIVNNLSKNITKTEIKHIFSCPEIPNCRIKHLLSKWGERTSTAFITFEHAEDYATALNMNGTTVGLKNIEVSSITREEMLAILGRNRLIKIWRPQPYVKAKDNLLCIYARNFPANVMKIDVRDFFMDFQVCENKIRLLMDSQGNGIGEAIVDLGCEKIARQAQNVLHGRHFMGTKILLARISRQQMKEILGTL
ncbi:RNA-binding protein 12B [Triplophysa tibetana]|uniref:RNA-binding protein 12B n=1 Tax=Triplophysa tibetana TaxID=1572043 RepID=A0A5A9N2T1_9TELE|nr:RNA-binding protein 12B [Triplophysa tibetana]